VETEPELKMVGDESIGLWHLTRWGQEELHVHTDYILHSALIAATLRKAFSTQCSEDSSAERSPKNTNQ